MGDIDVPVLIVGGGACGIAASVFLSDHGVDHLLVERHEGTSLLPKAHYGADGGKTLGEMLGVAMHGQRGLVDMVSAHVTADLSRHWPDECLITNLMNPDGAGTALGSGALVQMGPTWGRHSEQWAVHFSFGPDDPARFYDGTTIVPRIRALLNLPDLELTVHRVSRWILEAVMAERYRVGRVFLVGDAAHRHPPTGLGLNMAFQDVHNLTWKLAGVLAGPAGEGLLDTYEAERKPVAVRNVDWAMFTFMNRLVVATGFGIIPGMPPEVNTAAFRAYFDQTPMGATRRARAAEVLATQRTEFQAHDVELGFSYPVGALVPDGSEPPPQDPMGGLYHPVTRPGHRLPHAWLERGGDRRSTLDLAGRGFALITGADGEAWATAARRAADKLDLPLVVARVGAGEWADPNRGWQEVREISEGGAVLVRPDNHVARRSMAAAADAESAQVTLTRVLTAVLAR